MGYVVGTTSCPCGVSSDAFKLYSDGDGLCYSGNCPHKDKDTGKAYFTKSQVQEYLGNGIMAEVKVKKETIKLEFLDYKIYDLKSRGITKKTCEFFKYGIHKKTLEDGSIKYIHVANWFKDDKVIGQKMRDENKDFWVKGNITDLYGMHLWQGGKFIVITEGELDALSYAEATQCKYPVVSLSNGAGSAKKTLQQHLRWLEANFETIILAFDADKAGQDAAQDAATIFQPNKVKIAIYPSGLKDINEMLVKGLVQEIVSIPFQAKSYKPSRILYVDDLKERTRKPLQIGANFPFKSMTEMTRGFRKKEVIVIGAGTGCGKTFICKTMIIELRKQGKKVGIFFLEEDPALTMKFLIGMYLGKPFHLDPDCVTDAEIDKAEEFLMGKDGKGIVFNENFGCNSVENIKEQMYWMLNADEVEYVFLDHISALSYSDPGKSSKENLDGIMQDLATMTQEKDFGLVVVTHLRKQQGGKSHEEGRAPSMDDFLGSAAIKQWAFYCFVLQRNLKAKDGTKNQVIMTCLKDRLSGQAAGNEIHLTYDPSKNRVSENAGFGFDFTPDGPGFSGGTPF